MGCRFPASIFGVSPELLLLGRAGIGDWFPDPDIKGSDLRALVPSHEGSKALPTMERSGVMKALSTLEVSVTSYSDPVDGGNGGPFGVGDGEVQVGWKGRSADGPHGRDEAIAGPGLPVKDLGTDVPGIVGITCSDDAKVSYSRR